MRDGAKKLGQYFLFNRKKLQKIVELLDLRSGDVLMEIGPGRGALTGEIVKKLKAVAAGEFELILMEKDEELVRELRRKFHGERGLSVVEGDALKNLKSQILKLKNANLEPVVKNLKIVGNIPYYITGRLLRILGELENKSSLIVITVQKEVAERICGRPPKMNLLAASVQFWAEPKIAERVSRNDFRPRPKVESAVLRLEVRVSQPSVAEAKIYYPFIRQLFRQPRKTIFNNLKSIIAGRRPQSLEAVLNLRPQNLSLEQIKKLAIDCAAKKGILSKTEQG